MTAPNSPAEHEEIDFFDEVERQLMQLTTARLEEKKKIQPAGSLPSAHLVPFTPKTVIPANAGTHAEYHDTTNNESAATQSGDTFRRAPEVISGYGRNNKHQRNN